ncbi:MAG: tryptophan synthase subunit alpha [Candidatus Nitrosotenuis sp.]|uniref:Tryptophan synthase alpha chain n=1 Tax=Candidatus Nitrosotenuis uzonensis TaxID=1407055 RepID=A0A812EXA7_9ARCH|nr:tryptophan synthase subunit alpha [Candidatus Nitrosotenuis uzonensis]MCA2003387.1 tryptophan synthase subunit alpha [Candidatus Nitrosotenuis sp.]CAE6498906.1 Tryptophan synthase alpha chain [Candidatus Nitrosotenuis uzonensis]
MSENNSRIKAKFAELESRNETALIMYVMVGYPNGKSMMPIIRGLIKGGADIIELGFPFSDPLADGPVIQNASTASLESGTKISHMLSLVRQIRKESQIPLVLMTYTNILYRQGYDRFFKSAKAAGIDGLITPDMTVDSKEYHAAAKKHDIDTIFLVSPNTSQSRLRKIVSKTTGFLYLVSVFGTTGVQNKIQKYTIEALKRTKNAAGGKVPVGIGFGISTPDDVSNYKRQGADAVIVGSALIKIIEKTPHAKLQSAVTKYTKNMKRATQMSV